MMHNRIHMSDCVEGMRALPDACIPMTLTSPPYDDLRRFGGHRWDWEIFTAIADELWRLTTPGGVVCWAVRDGFGKSGQTGSSFRQALHFLDLGFHLHNTLVIDKQIVRGTSAVRYGVAPEYVFVLSKGKPRSVHLIRDKRNSPESSDLLFTDRDRDGSLVRKPFRRPFREYGVRGNVWWVPVGGPMTTRDRYAFQHSALMPERLARDLIVSWSNPGDLVLDPMAGAATTCKMSLLEGRRYLGFEVNPEYHALALRRMDEAHALYRRRLDSWLLGA